MNNYPFQELKQLVSDQKVILLALKTEINAMGSHPLPHQHSTVRACEEWLISKEPFLGLPKGQLDYLNSVLELAERAINHD